MGSEEKIVGGISRRIEKVEFVEVYSEVRDRMMKFIFDYQCTKVYKTKKTEVSNGKTRKR